MIQKVIFSNQENNQKFIFKGKRVLVMGLGLHGGGAGTVRFLARAGARITVTDLRSRRVLAPSLEKLKTLRGITYILGRHRKKDFYRAQLIIKNPAIPSNSSYLKIAEKLRIPVTSDLGIFFQKCPAATIGVTGTRGKSTTAYLIYRFLKTKKSRVWLAGNIRKSALELLPRLRKHDLVVLELSSFQLEDLARDKISPHIAVITNILRDHLNRHGGMPNYEKAKSYIFKFQKKNDLLFLNAGDGRLGKLARKAVSKKILVRLPRALERMVDSRLGRHYRSSVGLATAIAKHFGISGNALRKTLLSFRGLPGREEVVANVRGVIFINDTTATTPDAAIAALKRFRPKAAARKIILIAGGQDKKLQFGKLAAEISRTADDLILLPGTATKKIERELRAEKYELRNLHTAGSMLQAVRTAYRQAGKGDYVLLSPGAASFGLFLNEFDRGDKFVEEVRRLK